MKISKCCNKNDQQTLNVLKKHSNYLFLRDFDSFSTAKSTSLT